MTIDEFIRYMGNKPFYHFTDTRNLPLIRQNGLLSLRNLNAKGIQIPALAEINGATMLMSESD